MTQVFSLAGKYLFSLVMSTMDQGFDDIAYILLQKDMNLNDKNWDGETPLFKAASKRYTEIVKLLLDKKADPNCHACLNGFNYIEKLYLGTTVNTIYTKSARTTQYVYRSLPNYGRAMVLNRDSHEQCDSSYYEPSNIEKSHLQISICNVKYSFLPYKSYEISPLQIAASKGYTDIVKLLLDHNAEHDNITEYYQIGSPLFIASNQNHFDIVNLLLDNKPSDDKIVSNIPACKNLTNGNPVAVKLTSCFTNRCCKRS